jgi:hypothetical protein
MSTQFNDQWILDRINSTRRQSTSPKSVWPARTRRSRKGRWMSPLSTHAIQVLDKHPKWVERDL